MVLLSSANGASSEINMQFLEIALYELLRARQILCGSYVYGYYLEDNGYNKTVFEMTQNDLELAVEKLSEMIARPYLQTPCAKIISATKMVKKQRINFISTVLEGLIPPETPPILRKINRSGTDSTEDEELSQAILASLNDYDPDNPWVKDEQGRHTNLEAIYDWPCSPDSDEDSDKENNEASGNSASVVGFCARKDCIKARVRNCRTGEMHDYCSLICKHIDQNELDGSTSSASLIDPNVELMIALELSKQQTNFSEVLPENIFFPDWDLSLPKEVSIQDPQNQRGEPFLSAVNSQQEIKSGHNSEILPDGILDSVKLDSPDEPVKNEQEETNCDSTVPFALSSPDDKADDFAKTIKNTSVDFYLKNSPKNSEFDSKNINSSTGIFSKAQKELFSNVEKANDIQYQKKKKSSRHSL